MLVSEVENCHNLVKILLVCDDRLHRCVCVAAGRTVSSVWKSISSQAVLGRHLVTVGQDDMIMYIVAAIQITC